MKRPVWYRLARLVMLGIREPFYSPAFCLFFGFGLGMIAMLMSIQGIDKELDRSWTMAIAEVVKSCEVAGK